MKRLFVIVAMSLLAASAAILPGLTRYSTPETADAQSGQDGIAIPFEPLVRGVPGDYWADVIIGKPDFSEITPKEVVPFKVFNPGGVVVDRSVDPGRAYVWDAGNSRILGIDLAKCYASESPCGADIVLGQPSLYDHSACNGDSGVQNFPYQPQASAETLCGTPAVSQSPGEHHTFISMAVDEAGNLYVPDSYNHRVLFYERPFETDTVADAVWGQEGFSSNICNRGNYNSPTAESLCFHSSDTYSREPAMGGWPANGVALDSVGNLWIADTANHRVLRFPLHPETGLARDTADLVLGQPDFNRNGKGSDLRSMFTPAALVFDLAGRLFVADAYNNRVLVFDPPFSTGMSATATFGNGFRNPTGLGIDPEGKGVWVNDFAVGAVTLWNYTGNQLLKVIGKLDGGISYPHIAGNPALHHVGGFGIDRRGNMLVVFAANVAHDVMLFPSPIPDIDSGLISQPDKRFFYPPDEFNFMGRKGLRAGFSIATFQDQLIVSDLGRLMFWDSLQELSNGKPADGIIGDTHYRRGWLACCGVINDDGAGRLWVNGAEGSWQFIDVYQLPLTHQSSPLHTIWTRNVSLPVLGMDTELELGHRLFGMAPTKGGEFLWLSDTDNHRVLRIRNPLTDPVVDVILGQKAPGGAECNRGKGGTPDIDTLCFPGDISFDRLGNLWVSDHSLEVSGNLRLLTFGGYLFPTDVDTAILAPDATGVISSHGNANTRLSVGFYEPARRIENQRHGPYPAATFEPAFDSRNRMAVGFNMYVGARFVAVYDDPSRPGAEPSGYLNDLASMPVSATFDRYDNLYIGDHNRARVLVYWNPMKNPPRSAEEHEELERPVPLPEYPTEVRVVSPSPPDCVLRFPDHPADGILKLSTEDLPDLNRLQLQIRKIASADVHTLPINGDGARVEGTTISVRQIWSHLWREYENTAAFVRVLRDGKPLTGWSPSFTIAEDAKTCEHSRPAPTPAPMPTSVPPPTSIPTPTLRPEPSDAAVTLSATLESPTPDMTDLPSTTVPLPRAAVLPTALAPPVRSDAAAPATDTLRRPATHPADLPIVLIVALIIAGVILLGLGFVAGRALGR